MLARPVLVIAAAKTAITTKAAACVLSLCAITLAGLHLAITTVATLQATFSPLESAIFAPR